MEYDLLEEAKMRLEGTVVMYDGNPVNVAEVAGKAPFVIRMVTLPMMRADLSVSLKDPLLECRQFKLGYMNHRRDAYYLSRMPVRRYKQGLNGENVSIPHFNGYRPGWKEVISSQSFVDMMTGTYPSFDEAVETLGTVDARTGGLIDSQAFHKNFAVSKDELGLVFLHYKGNKIAWKHAEGFVLPSEHMYLKEVLDQTGVKVAQ